MKSEAELQVRAERNPPQPCQPRRQHNDGPTTHGAQGVNNKLVAHLTHENSSIEETRSLSQRAIGAMSGSTQPSIGLANSTFLGQKSHIATLNCSACEFVVDRDRHEKDAEPY